MFSYFIYNVSAIISIVFSALYEKRRFSKETKWVFLIISFCSLLFVAILRFDVGPDYETYVRMFYNANFYESEIFTDKSLFMVLSRLFSIFERGYLLVFLFYGFFTLFFIFKTLLDRKILAWGILLFCFLGIYLDLLDRIRQFLAVSIFLYSIRYIEREEFIKYFLFLAFGSVFHLSILFLLPVYFFGKVRLHIILCYIIIISLSVMYTLGYTQNISNYLYTIIPYYNSIYADTELSNTSGNFSTGMGFIFNMSVIIYAIYLSRDNDLYKNILLCSIVLYLLSPGNLNISRIADYYRSLVIIAIPVGLKYTKHNILSKIILVSLLFVFFQAQISRNNFEYYSIFSDKFNIEIFDLRNR